MADRVTDERERDGNMNERASEVPVSMTGPPTIPSEPPTLQQELAPLRHHEPDSPKSESTEKLRYPSSLDFERVVNDFSIQAMRDRVFFKESREVEQEELDEETQDTTKEPLSHSWSNEALQAYNTFDTELNDSIPPPPPPPPPQTKRRGKKTPLGYTGRTATRWVLTNATGLMTGGISILIVSATDSISTWRSNLLNTLWKNDQRSYFIFLLYAGTNLGLALLSSALCLFLAPEAVGSGIPQVKAYLNGVRVKRFTSMGLFLVKIVATILSVSSGLVIGPEGPLVHMGAILGASCTKLSNFMLRFLPRSCSKYLWTFVTTDLSHFSNDAERRDLVSIGAAAGFAAAFGAPIGGLLFTLEEASSYFDQSMFVKTLAATALATFCLAVHHGDLSDYSIISMGNFQTPNENIFLNRVAEVPLFVLVGISGGVLGGAFCRFWKFLQLRRERLFPQGGIRTMVQLLEVAIVSLLTSTLTYWIPLMEWACRPVDEDDDLTAERKYAVNPWKFHAHQFDCRLGRINELATIFFGSREEAIADILSDPTQFHPQTLWTTGFVFFVLMTLTLGVSIPSGIFMPTFLIGSSLGGAAGIIFQDWFNPELSASTFALLGAAALLAGVQRSTVSLCVIMVEGTGHVKALIPVIITVVTARWIADFIAEHGLYETAMEINHYPYLDHKETKVYDVFQVRDIMSAPAVTLGPRERAHTLVKLLRESEHHGFPVVDPMTRKFLGLVRRDQLVALLECGVFDDARAFDDSDSSVASSGYTTPTEWTPKPGIGKSPMMHLAFHIKDDRYEHLSDRHLPVSSNTLSQDEYDSNAWLLSIRHGREHLASMNQEQAGEAQVLVGDDSVPPVTVAPQGHDDNDMAEAPDQYAKVGTNRKGNVYIQWMNPYYKRNWIHVAAVMNRGTYCVNEYCPVSKAHRLFTALGLRHMVVLGGETGGEVVGVLTRINLLKEYIEERTGCEL